MGAGAGPGEYGSAQMQFGSNLIARFKQPGGLLQDLAFDRSKVIDDGNTRDYLLDHKYEGGGSRLFRWFKRLRIRATWVT